jgi:hypothetical protein
MFAPTDVGFFFFLISLAPVDTVFWGILPTHEVILGAGSMAQW